MGNREGDQSATEGEEVQVSVAGYGGWGFGGSAAGGLGASLFQCGEIRAQQEPTIQWEYWGAAHMENAVNKEGVNRLSDLFVVMRMIQSLTDHLDEEMQTWDGDMDDAAWDDLVGRLFYISDWADGRR